MADVVDQNLLALADEVNRAVERHLGQLAGIKPGMSVEERMSALGQLSPAQRQTAINDVANAAGFNRAALGDVTMPSSVTAGLTGGIKGTLIGPEVYGEGQLSANWDIARTTNYNLNHQTEFLRAAQEKYGVTPDSASHNSLGNNIQSWWHNQFGPSGDFSHAGGISSAPIGDGMDLGNWNVVVCFGLLYKIHTANAAAESEVQL